MKELTNTTIQEIINEFEIIGAIDKEAEFVCYVDNIFVYEIIDDFVKHEIQVINEDAIFMRNEKVRHLLELNNSFFISHRAFDMKDEPLCGERIVRIVDSSSYQSEERSKINN